MKRKTDNAPRFPQSDAPAEQASDARRRLEDITRLVSDWVWETDSDFRLTYASQRITEILGYQPVELLGKQLTDFGRFVSRDDSPIDLKMTSPFRDASFETTHKTGEHRYFLVSGLPIFNPDTGNFDGVRGTARDITRRREVEKQIMWQVSHDPLTELPNRTLFFDRLSQAISGARRYSRQVALLFADLDRFKTINDSLGHAAGDHLLTLAAQRLVSCIRETDTVARIGDKIAGTPGEETEEMVARLGGDEFTIILTQITRPDDAAIVARRIVEEFSKPFHLDGHEAHVGASIGITAFPDDADDSISLLRNADIAMYQAKKDGPNAYMFYTPELNTEVQNKLSLETELHNALKENELIVHFQPIIHIATGKIEGAESLIRWKHPERGLVPPNDFIPLAEESGLIGPIGEYVLREVGRQIRSWNESGLTVPNISVNLSSRQLSRGLTVEKVAALLRESGTHPSLITFEITENLFMEETDRAKDWLNRIKKLGIRLSVDDFGTGYSSLGYLRRFPVDTLKIDRSFVTDLPGNSGDASLTEAIIAMAKSLKLSVVAEGVETWDQLEFLRSLNCDYAQGYLFSRPLPADDFAAFLKSPAPIFSAAGSARNLSPSLAPAGE
ncbi:MAG: EAL domain-containing protein [Rhodospirillales bacterium]|nr:EAL domain-containing protein [Rhodospirillales bacterium]